jgi:acyl-CoA synthetase (AMP-forming)/AMP-acid ligase II
MNPCLHLMRAAMWYPERIAVVDVGEDTRLTFRELNERVNRLANALSSLGFRKGDRVASLSSNRYQLVEITFACHKIGLIGVPLNARLSMAEMVYMLNNSESSALLLGPEYIEEMEKVRSEIKTVKHYISLSYPSPTMIGYEDLVRSGSADDPKIEVEMDDIADLKYTSGTTGKIKAAMMSYRSKLCQTRKVLLRDSNIRKDSAMCHVAPITHASGIMLLPFIMKGARNVLLPGFDIPLLLKTIEKERITHMLAVPTMLNFLMAYPDLKKYDLSSIETIIYAASPMPVEKIKQALEIFGPVLKQGYGLTETSAGIACLTQEDHIIDGDPKKLRRLASAGRPVSECDVRVVNEKGEDVKPGEVGEVIERGDDMMLGYWKDPELTAQTLRNGWLYTKDMATVDEDGYIYLVDRKGDMIISGGFNIYPSEVEGVLAGHPAVFESAVIGIPDDKWGESVKALVVLKEGMTASEEELINHCKQHLSSYKKPKSVDFVKELPKNPIGKVLKRKLKEQYWGGQEKMIH